MQHFFTTKDTNDPKKFHGMNNAFPQSKPFSMKFFRVILCFSLFKKNFSVTGFTDPLPRKSRKSRNPLKPARHLSIDHYFIQILELEIAFSRQYKLICRIQVLKSPNSTAGMHHGTKLLP